MDEMRHFMGDDEAPHFWGREDQAPAEPNPLR
jgi:hypothetical protein